MQGCPSKDLTSRFYIKEQLRPLFTPQLISEFQNAVDGSKLEFDGKVVTIRGATHILDEVRVALEKFIKKAEEERSDAKTQSSFKQERNEEPPDRNGKGKEKMLEEEARRGKRKRDECKERTCYKCQEPGYIAKVLTNHSVLMHIFNRTLGFIHIVSFFFFSRNLDVFLLNCSFAGLKIILRK